MAKTTVYSTVDNAAYLEMSRALSNGPNRCLWRVAGPAMSDGGSIVEAWWTRHGMIVLHAHGVDDHACLAILWDKGIGESFDEIRAHFGYTAEEMSA